jgi:hypothetical protein
MKQEAQRVSADVSESEVNPSGNRPGDTTIRESRIAVGLDLVDTSRNRSSFASEYDSQSANSERSRSNGMLGDGNKSFSTKRRGTGPQTQEGKKRSRLNACRHGLFAKVALLRHESRGEFEDLLNDFQNDFHPVGKFENLTVEQLAFAYWRKRRWFIAEGAEIQKGINSVEREEEREQEERVAETLRSSTNCNGGLITTIANPKLLERCLELLAQLKSGIKRDGINPQCDKEILTNLYGEYHQEDLRHTLFNSYLVWFYHTHCPDEKRQDDAIASPEKAKQNFLDEIELEEKRLRCLKKERAEEESARRKLVSLSRNIPVPAEMDRLLRYGASIDREIDRLLKQLERLQRMRLGQPVLPPIDINVSLED